mmetsp:Transcript_40481/g.64928  ORF Transcript_40481/g.64928 Transcript_40481/m.64928 type:complete len:114 (+) Transcript_40481:1246-1587(+)|eukprot:CAMPEP_0197026186 /NCGR_PEP_ID=MMETSP1384-20130603/6339_1 /TAXON_ID=29189 /ORGANISM="Ammonia sp." /LENGTH=113 /DNA_ID=CAMNT_0042454807 /DNA_START=21 /DNA_END=362 /DNA_ORIENTATION=-
MAQQKQSQTWDQQSIDKYKNQMAQKIKQVIGNADFTGNVAMMVNNVNSESDKLLKAMDKPDYKYISTVLIVPKGGSYRTGQITYWQPKTDKTIKVSVETENLHIVVNAHCVQI